MNKERKFDALIKRWQFVFADDGKSIKIGGYVFDDRKGRFDDGQYVTTSRIVKLDMEKKLAQTKNTVYVLV